MKNLLEIKTFENSAGEETWSTFVKMYVEFYPNDKPIIVATFDEKRESDGTWTREYPMRVIPETILKVYVTVNGQRQQLMRNSNVIGIPTPVTVDEFTLMRFLCWDNNFSSLKAVVSSGILRRKAAEEALRNNQEPAPHDFDLPPSIPVQYFLAYLDDVLENPLS